MDKVVDEDHLDHSVDALRADARPRLGARLGAARPLEEGLAFDIRLNEHVARDERPARQLLRV